MKANEILAIGNEIFSTNERKSIYKKEIFAECKTDKEKKNLRMKLRKKLDTFIAEFIASNKNIEKRKALKASIYKSKLHRRCKCKYRKKGHNQKFLTCNE